MKAKIPAALVGVLLATLGPPAWSQAEFSELKVIVETNATDGDIGFHVLLDADAWHLVRIFDPTGRQIFQEKAKGSLSEQGLTENFFESAEPLCSPDLVEEEDDEVVTLAEFQERFAAGFYVFTGRNNEREMLAGLAELTYNLPAAPDIDAFDGAEDVDPTAAEITWAAGDDLGECPFDGLIPDPASVPVIGWEVVVEPAEDGVVNPKRVFSVQLPANQMSVTVPEEFLNTYIAQGVTAFKFEVGAIEASGNQTFSEGGFCTAECPAEE